MRYVVAPDSFKGSLSAAQAAHSIRAGIIRAEPEADVVLVPIADGGEGTLDAILTAVGGARVDFEVIGPDGNAVCACVGFISNSSSQTVAVVEMAQAAGLGLIAQSKRNPSFTTTFGVGQMIAAAFDSGAEEIIIGLGGSCTNDGGAGALQALGVDFLDSNGLSLSEHVCGADLIRLARIDMSRMNPKLRQVRFVLASDVTNPLLGKMGASAVFGPQKGATLDQIVELDRALTQFVRVVHQVLGVDIASLKGAGAAGGLGGGLMGFLGAEMRSGIDLVLDLADFDNLIADADFVFTGEGRIDHQSLHGKAISGVMARCSKYSVPVVAFGGSVDEDAEGELVQKVLLAAIPIVDRPMSLDDAIGGAAKLLEYAAERVVRLLQGGS